MVQKFYAVKKGRKTGIFKNWEACKRQVSGFSNAKFKSFKTLPDAQAYLGIKSNQLEKLGSTTTEAMKPQQAKVSVYQTAQSLEHRVVVYTDGGYRKSSQIGAYAYVVQDLQPNNGSSNYYNRAVPNTTNQRMELSALLSFLEHSFTEYHNLPITIVTDSAYMKNMFTKGWFDKWKHNFWTKANGHPVKNQDILKELDYYLSKFSDINFKWTKGHAYNQGNNQADYLVNQAMDQYLAETYNSWY